MKKNCLSKYYVKIKVAFYKNKIHKNQVYKNSKLFNFFLNVNLDTYYMFFKFPKQKKLINITKSIKKNNMITE